MCRIYGNVSVEKSGPIDMDTFRALLQLSKSGGPDSTEIFADALTQFGFNRLAVIDTSQNGNQPIVSPSGRFILMLNGEIYNFKELESEFGLKGLRSGSDAEVVAQLLDRLAFGEVIGKLNGMFAISVWDKSARQLYLARDFAGIKPLFYGLSENGMVFGSQFNQILLHPWMKCWKWSETGLSEYLQFGFMSPPLTLAKHVFQLEPGTWLQYSILTNEFKIYTYIRFFQDDKSSLIELAKTTVNEGHSALTHAVKRQLVADVPIGIFLSSGVDSSLLAAIASKFRPDIETMTIGFEQPEYDESEKASEYARILGLKNHCVTISDAEFLNFFHNHNNALSEPLADYSTLPTYLISKIAAERYKVMISGDGGDELFWGYPRFRTFARSSPYFKIPSTTVRKVVKKILKTAKCDVTGFLHEPSIGSANLGFHSALPESLIKKIWPESGISEHIKNQYIFNSYKIEHVLQHLRQNEFYQHLQKILVKVDRMSMANGLEVRVPFLDQEVISYAERIKPGLLRNHHEVKAILKNLLQLYIPKEKIEQRKRGFTPPLKKWSRTILSSHIKDVLAETYQINFPFSNKQALIQYGEDYLSSKHDNLDGLWTIYSLVTWENRLRNTKIPK